VPTTPSVLDKLPVSSLLLIVSPSGLRSSTLAEDAPLAFHAKVNVVLLILPLDGPKLRLGSGITGSGGGGGGGGAGFTVTELDADPPAVCIVAVQVAAIPSVLVILPVRSVSTEVSPVEVVIVIVAEGAPLAFQDRVKRVSLIVPELGLKLILGDGITGAGGGAGFTVTDVEALPDDVTIEARHVPTIPNVLVIELLGSEIFTTVLSGEVSETVLEPAVPSSHANV